MSLDDKQNENIGKLWGTVIELRSKSEASTQNLMEHLFGVSGNNGISGRLKKVEEKVAVLTKELPETLNSISLRWHNDRKDLIDQVNTYRYSEAPEIYLAKKDFEKQVALCDGRQEKLEENKIRKVDVNIQLILLVLNLGVMITGIVSIFVFL